MSKERTKQTNVKDGSSKSEKPTGDHTNDDSGDSSEQDSDLTTTALINTPHKNEMTSTAEKQQAEKDEKRVEKVIDFEQKLEFNYSFDIYSLESLL